MSDESDRIPTARELHGEFSRGLEIVEGVEGDISAAVELILNSTIATALLGILSQLERMNVYWEIMVNQLPRR